MSKYRMSKFAVCPFYRHENRSVVYCDGIVEESVIHVAFSSPAPAYKFKLAFCQKDFKKCPVYQMLERRERES